MVTYTKDDNGKVLKYSEITDADVAMLKRDIARQIDRIKRSEDRVITENEKLNELNSALDALVELGLE